MYMGSTCGRTKLVNGKNVAMDGSSKVVDLEQRIKEWAVKAATDSSIKNAKKAKIDIKWERVTFTADEPEWKPVDCIPRPPNVTIYSSCFRNNTNQKAEHTLRVERSSTATSKTSISSGFTTGFNLGLSLALPHEVASATASYGRSVTINKAEETTVQHVQSWSVDTVIPAPPQVLTKATVEVTENVWKGKFTLPVRIKGMIVVNLYDQNTPGSFLCTMEQSVDELLPQFGAAQRAGSGEVKWPLQGFSDFQFGVEQMIDIQNESL